MSFKYDSFYHPLGRGNAAINFDGVIKDLKSRYFNSVSKDLLVSCIYNKGKDKYIFFFKVPSEENNDYPTALMYDVVLEFVPPRDHKDSAKESGTLKGYDINIYSNSPGFVFTFAYIVKNKYNAAPACIPYNLWSKLAITKAPETRNMNQIMTIEKTTWWCLFHLDYNGYLNKNQLETIISDKGENYFVKKMVSQPEKLKEIQALKQVMREEKLKEKAKKNSNNKDFKNVNKVRAEGRDPLAYSLQVSANQKKTGLFDRLLHHNPLVKKMNKKNQKKNDPLNFKSGMRYDFK